MTMPSKRKVTIENLGEFRWMVSGGLMVEPVNKPGNILCITDEYCYNWTPCFVCDAIKNAIKNGWDIQGKSQVNYYTLYQLDCIHEYVQYYDTNREVCKFCNRIQFYDDDIKYVADVIKDLIERGISSDEHIASFASQETEHPSKERMLKIISDSRFIHIMKYNLRSLLEEAWDDK